MEAGANRHGTLVGALAAVVLCVAAPSASAAGLTITPVKGQRWSGVVGSGHQGCPIDPDLPNPNTHNCDLLGPESSMKASIDWGDGTGVDSTATVSRSCAHSTDASCTVLVSGSHTYAAAGSFNGSFTWSDPDPDYPANGSGTFTANVAATAPPVLQTIDFDDLEPGTAVGTSYNLQGVDFGKKPGGASGGNPLVTDAENAAAQGSDPNAARVSSAIDPEVWAAFASPKAKVYVKAGNPISPATVTLAGYDSTGHQVGSTQQSVAGGATTQLSLELASATISFVRISEAQPSGGLLIDDFSYYVPGDGAYTLSPFDNISVVTCCQDATGQVYDGDYSGTVAHIYKSDSVSDTAADYSATIRWGDGTSSTGTIGASTKLGADYDVYGSHHYAPVDSPTWYRVVVHVVKKTGLAQTTRESALASPPPPPPNGPIARFDMTEPTGYGARPDQTPLHFDASQSKSSTCTSPSGCAPPSFPMKEYRWTIHLTSYNPANPDPTLVVTCPGNEPTMTAVFTDPRTWRVDLQVTNSDGKSDGVTHDFDIQRNESPNQYHYNRVLALCGTHYGDLPDMTDFSPSYAKTPQALQPGTLVTIKGMGFKPGTRVWFGTVAGRVDPESLTSDTITARVPPRATTGVITLEVPVDGDPDHPILIQSARALFVDNYRDVNGYRFRNSGPSDITFDQLTRAFGADQTYDSVNPCWPWADCSVSWRDPVAMGFDFVANQLLRGKGSCWGISLTSKLFMTGALRLKDYPHTGGDDVFHLDGREAPSGPLRELLNAAQVQQLSYEFLTDYAGRSAGQLVMGGAATAHKVRAEVEDSLRAGEYPIVTLRDGGKGHAVVAYDVTDDPDQAGSYYIWVYDSNDPSLLPVDDPSTVFPSRVHVDSDGRWTLPSTGLSGGGSSILVWRLSNLPSHPHMASALLAATPAIIVFGSGDSERTTQLSDATGHKLYDAAGELNRDPRTRLDAMPFAPLTGGDSHGPADVFVLPHGASGLKQTVTGTGSGSVSYTLVHSGLMAQVHTHASKGMAGQLDLNPAAGSVGFSTQAAHAPVTLTLLGAAGETKRVAQVTTTGFKGGGDHLAFTAGKAGFSFVHHGPATDVSLTLSGSAQGALPSTFQSEPVHVGRGQAVHVRGIRWDRVGARRLKVTVGGRRRTLSNRSRVPRLGAITSLRSKRLARGRLRLTIGTRIARVPSGSKVVLTWVVHRGRRVVRTHALALAGRRGKLSRAWSFVPPHPGKYTLTANLVVLFGRGATQASSRASRSLTIRTG